MFRVSLLYCCYYCFRASPPASRRSAVGVNCQSFKDKFQPALVVAFYGRIMCARVLGQLPVARTPCFYFFPPFRPEAAAAAAVSVCVCVQSVTNPAVFPTDEDEPEDAASDVDEVPKSKKKKKAKKSSRESRSSKRQRPIREVSSALAKVLSPSKRFQLQTGENHV